MTDAVDRSEVVGGPGTTGIGEITGLDLIELAISQEEQALEQFRIRAWLCAMAVASGQEKGLADIYKCAVRRIRKLGGIFVRWGAENLISPDLPLRIYDVCEQTPDPYLWFKLATQPDFRKEWLGKDDGKGIWSTRDLQDAADITSGKKVSRISWFSGRGAVGWDGTHIFVEPGRDWTPSGDKPKVAEVSIKEVLENV